MKSRLAPLSSIEATIGGMNSFVKTICTEYPDLFDGKEVRLLNRREAVVLFETHRHLLLPNGSQFSSTPQTIRSLVHNIHFLKSRGVTPAAYASQLSLLYASRPKDPYFAKYSAFGTVFSLFDQLLRDRGLATDSDVLAQLLESPLLLDLLADRWPHVIVPAIESFPPLHRRFLHALVTHAKNETALVTQHVSLAPEDGGNPAELFSFPHEELTDACEMEPFIGLLNRRFLAPKTISLEAFHSRVLNA